MSIKTERDNWKEKASKAQHQAMFFLKERERMKKIAVAAVLAWIFRAGGNAAANRPGMVAGMSRRDPDEYLLVPADFETPPRAAGVSCPCGALDVCICDGVTEQEGYQCQD